jgi:catechol 2,3-dioxygenase-like lactoylglutathione lyase family enzyme
MTGPFRMLHHICLVVHDIERSVAWYESIGIGPWLPYPPLTEYTTLEVPNPDAFAAMQYRYVNLENVQLQLCQPPELDCPQRRFLDERGEGVFQLGFEHPWETAATAGAEVGLRVLMSGRRANGTGFVYFDTLRETGVALMTRQTHAGEGRAALDTSDSLQLPDPTR